jgi:uncharacterized protein YgbK (DUF1537 family)
MIAVIADDLTGAAELGGIGLRYGLSVEVNMEVNLSTKAELLVIAADTRSMGEEDAVKEMKRITRKLMLLQPEWIYKKVDSVLRGHVVAEINIQLKVSGMKRALLIPANPALGRTIKNGVYFLNGTPVHKSSFAMDPEFAIMSSDVRDMLHADDVPVAIHVKKHSEELADSGIIVGEAQKKDDIEVWAALAGRTDEPMLLAGASGFFRALLRARKGSEEDKKGPDELGVLPGYPVLFVSGTTFGKNQALIRGIYEAGGPVSYISADAVSAGSNAEELSFETIVNHLLDQGKAVVAIEGTASGDPIQAARMLRGWMARLVRRVLTEVDVEELVIEGGATAYAILVQAGLRAFFPEEELAPGMVRMRAQADFPLYVTVKPGSYEWPALVRHRLEN